MSSEYSTGRKGTSPKGQFAVSCTDPGPFLTQTRMIITLTEALQLTPWLSLMPGTQVSASVQNLLPCHVRSPA